jgi:phosphoribosylglycinamide formyltransferase-1
VVSNKADAQVLERASRLGVDSVVADKAKLHDPAVMMPLLGNYQADFIVLAGFLPLVPDYILEAYPRRIINIHPALLPKYGGKGMHGMHVHEAVVAAGEVETGITIHLVDEQYDHGKTLFQAKCEVLPCDTALDVAAKSTCWSRNTSPKWWTAI